MTRIAMSGMLQGQHHAGPVTASARYVMALNSPSDAVSIRFSGFYKKPEEMSWLEKLQRKLAFYGPIFIATLMCSFINHKRIIQAWEPTAIFVPDRKIAVDQLESKMLKAKIQDVMIPSLDGTRINTWYVPAPAKSGKPTVVLAHGNQGNMMRIEDIMESFVNRGYGILAFDYRGYGKSEGKPSETGTYQDFLAASRYLANHPTHPVPVSEQVPFGESLGGGAVVGGIDYSHSRNMPAKDLAFKAVILSSTFTSIPDFYAEMKKRIGIPSWLFPMERRITQKFESVSKMHHIQSPLFLIHGTDDGDIPPFMTEVLQKKATNLPDPTWTDRYLVQGGGHTGLFVMEPDAIIDAFEKLMGRVYGSAWAEHKTT